MFYLTTDSTPYIGKKNKKKMKMKKKKVFVVPASAPRLVLKRSWYVLSC